MRINYKNIFKVITVSSRYYRNSQKLYKKNEVSSCALLESSNNAQSHVIKELNTINSLEETYYLCGQYLDKLTNISDDELLILLNHLYYFQINFPTCFAESNVLKNLVYKIDEVCIKKASKWDNETFLKIFKLYRSLLNINRVSPFTRYVIKHRLPKAIKNCTLPSLLELLECINKPNNLWRCYYVDKYELIYYLDKHFSNFNINEMGIYLRALLSLRTVLDDDELKIKIITALANNFEDATLYTLLNFLKFIEFQTWSKHNPFSLGPPFVSVLKIAFEKFDNIDFKVHSYVSVLCTKMLIYHPKYLEKVSLKYFNEISNLTIRQVNNVLYSLTFFNFHLDSLNIYEHFLTTIEKEPMHTVYTEHPKRLVQALMFLSCVKIYPYKLLNTIFSDDFLRKMYGKKLHVAMIQKSIFTLAIAMKIECTDYKGNTLNEELLQRKIKYNTEKLPDCFNAEYKFNNPENSLNIRSIHSKIICDSQYILTYTLGGANFTHVCYLLPHFPKANVLFCLDSQKNPVVLSDFLRSKTLIDSKFLDKNYDWYTVCIIKRNPFIQPDLSPPVINLEETKIRQLKTLGYNIIKIFCNEWTNLNFEEKYCFFKKYLNETNFQ